MSDRYHEPEHPAPSEPGPGPESSFAPHDESGAREPEPHERVPSVSPPEKRSPAQIVADTLRDTRWQVAEGPQPNRSTPDAVGNESRLPPDHAMTGRSFQGLDADKHDDRGDEPPAETHRPFAVQAMSAPKAPTNHPDALVHTDNRNVSAIDSNVGPERPRTSRVPDAPAAIVRSEEARASAPERDRPLIHGLALPAHPAAPPGEGDGPQADPPSSPDHRPTPRSSSSSSSSESRDSRIEGIAPPPIAERADPTERLTDRVPARDDSATEARVGVAPDKNPLPMFVAPTSSGAARVAPDSTTIGTIPDREQGCVRQAAVSVKMPRNIDPVRGFGNESPGGSAESDRRITLDSHSSRPGGYAPPVLSELGSRSTVGPAPGHSYEPRGDDFAGSSSHSFGFGEAAHGPQAGGAPAPDLSRTNDLLQQLVELVRRDRTRSLPSNDRRNNYSL